MCSHRTANAQAYANRPESCNLIVDCRKASELQGILKRKTRAAPRLGGTGPAQRMSQARDFWKKDESCSTRVLLQSLQGDVLGNFCICRYTLWIFADDAAADRSHCTHEGGVSSDECASAYWQVEMQCGCADGSCSVSASSSQHSFWT
eukprot:g22911.t1